MSHSMWPCSFVNCAAWFSPLPRVTASLKTHLFTKTTIDVLATSQRASSHVCVPSHDMFSLWNNESAGFFLPFSRPVAEIIMVSLLSFIFLCHDSWVITVQKEISTFPWLFHSDLFQLFIAMLSIKPYSEEPAGYLLYLNWSLDELQALLYTHWFKHWYDDYLFFNRKYWLTSLNKYFPS